MDPTRFVSFAQNSEDVVLWRALRGVPDGRYVDVGANSPETDSVTKAFYDRGWSGLNVEPMASFAAALREHRQRDVVVEAAVSTRDDGHAVLHEFGNTGLSTLRDDYVASHVGRGHTPHDVRVPTRRLDSLVSEHLSGEPVHFLKIDVEGAEADVLASVDLTTWRPWVVVVEATRPNSPEPTHEEWESSVVGAGYHRCLFDGLSRFYVSDEHADLAPALSYPACPLDEFVPAALVAAERALAEQQEASRATEQQLEDELTALRLELVRWRGAVLERWSIAVAQEAGEGVQAELEAMRRTVSWRVTRPLRAVRALQGRTSA